MRSLDIVLDGTSSAWLRLGTTFHRLPFVHGLGLEFPKEEPVWDWEGQSKAEAMTFGRLSQSAPMLGQCKGARETSVYVTSFYFASSSPFPLPVYCPGHQLGLGCRFAETAATQRRRLLRGEDFHSALHQLPPVWSSLTAWERLISWIIMKISVCPLNISA